MLKYMQGQSEGFQNQSNISHNQSIKSSNFLQMHIYFNNFHKTKDFVKNDFFRVYVLVYLSSLNTLYSFFFEKFLPYAKIITFFPFLFLRTTVCLSKNCFFFFFCWFIHFKNVCNCEIFSIFFFVFRSKNVDRVID